MIGVKKTGNGGGGGRLYALKSKLVHKGGLYYA